MLSIDPTLFQEQFNRQPFVVEHGLTDHPLFTLPRLLDLATEVAEKWPGDLYYDQGVTEIGQRWGATPNSFPIAETISKIENSGAWIDLKSAERNPEYARVLDSCISDILHVSAGQLKSKMRRTQMAIFITSPKRLSTYHIDSECNFLLHLRGEKQISIFDKFDRDVLTEEEIERSWTVDTNAAIYKPALQHRAQVVTLLPGKGVHIPVNAPHWVRNGEDISISVAILYHWWNREYANVYAANYYLRRVGMRPVPPFRSPIRDAIKQPIGAAAIAFRRVLRGPLRQY
jgi:hypothetical protein